MEEIMLKLSNAILQQVKAKTSLDSIIYADYHPVAEEIVIITDKDEQFIIEIRKTENEG